MKLTVAKVTKGSVRINKIFEFILYIISYTVAFLIVESLFDSFQLSGSYKSLYALLVSFSIRYIPKAMPSIIKIEYQYI